MVRDRLVCGVNDNAIQKRLLAEPSLTYQKAVELALSIETAAQSIRELRSKPDTGLSSQSAPQKVHKTCTPNAVPSQGGPKTPPTCYRCGLQGHIITKCRVSQDVVCHRERGHLQRVCKSRNKPDQKHQTKTVDIVPQDDKEEEGDVETILCHVKSPGVVNTPPILVSVKLDNCLVNMEVDTGASLTLMSETTFSGLWPGRSLQPSQVRLQSYLKEPIPVVGCCCDYNGQTCELPLVIVAGS